MSAPPYYVVGTDNYRKLINVVFLCISAYQRHSTSFETDVVFNVLRGFRPRRLFLSMRITLKLLIGVLSLPHSRVDRQCSLKWLNNVLMGTYVKPYLLTHYGRPLATLISLSNSEWAAAL